MAGFRGLDPEPRGILLGHVVPLSFDRPPGEPGGRSGRTGGLAIGDGNPLLQGPALSPCRSYPQSR